MPCRKPCVRTGIAQSLSDASSIVNASRFIAMPFMPDAYSALTTEPALVPHTRSIWTLRASSALITPMCAKPRAAPPPSASPTRIGRGGWTTGGGVVATGVSVDAALSGLLPVVVQAGRTVEAAASGEGPPAPGGGGRVHEGPLGRRRRRPAG